MKKELIIPSILFVSFFVFQVFAQPSELTLTITLLALIAITFLLHRNKGEGKMFLVGLGAGLFIEVVLGLVARQQHWENASLFGVPYWLPLIWGVAFPLITRIGMYFRKPRY